MIFAICFVIAAILISLMIKTASVEDLRFEITEWIRIGIAKDIIRAPAHRQEYASFLKIVNKEHELKRFKDVSEEHAFKVQKVLGKIEEECLIPKLQRFRRAIFWHLYFLELKKFCKRLRF